MNCNFYSPVNEKNIEINLEKGKRCLKLNSIINNQKININQNYNFEFKDKGFPNIGNTCFINSFLQILFHTPNFIKELTSYENENNNNIITHLINLSKSDNDKSKHLLFIQNFMCNEANDYFELVPNDSQQFGIDLINKIISIIKKEDNSFEIYLNESENENDSNILDINIKKYYEKYKKKYQQNEIILEKMFLINVSEKIYKSNKLCNIKFDTSLNIVLTFPEKLKNKTYFYLDDLLEFKYSNKNDILCNHKNKIIIKEKICKLPEILIITIARALINKKLNCSFLYFPENLNLNKYIDSNLIDTRNNINYKLFALNKKKGYIKENGHYYCKIKIRNNWYKFNDLAITPTKIKNNWSKKVVGLFYLRDTKYF